MRLAAEVEQAQQLGFALEQIKQLAQINQIGRQVIAIEQVFFASHHHRLTRPQGVLPGDNRRAHQAGDMALQIAQLAFQLARHRLQAAPGAVVIEKIGRLDQLAGGVVALGQQQMVLHIAIGGDKNQQHALF